MEDDLMETVDDLKFFRAWKMTKYFWKLKTTSICFENERLHYYSLFGKITKFWSRTLKSPTTINFWEVPGKLNLSCFEYIFFYF